MLYLLVLLFALVLATTVVVTNIKDKSRLRVNNNDSILIARIDGKPFYKRDFEDRLLAFSGNMDEEDIIDITQLPKSLVRRIVESVAINDKLDKLAHADRSIVRSEQIARSVDSYRRQLMRDEFLLRMSRRSITSPELQSKYKELLKDFEGKKERKIRHILVDTKEDALLVIKRIEASESFKQIAKDVSMDITTANNGGDLGYVVEEDLPADVAEVFFGKLQVGKLYGPFETSGGWHVAILDSIRPVAPPEFKDIEHELRLTMEKDNVSKYLDMMAASIPIDIIIGLDFDNVDRSS